MTDLFTNHQRYADLDAWHKEADALRAGGTVQWVDRSADGFPPFWAVLGLEEILEVERQPALFTNEPMSVLGKLSDVEASAASGARIRSLVQMDPPDHPKYRKLTSDWFKPAGLRQLQPRLDDLAVEALDRMEAAGGRCDFSADVAVWYPLAVILAILGLPDEDYPRMLKLTQELFGASDEDMGRGGIEGLIETVLDFFRYFGELTADRRANPTDDLATLIANGTIDGRPMPELEQMSYYVIVAAAGHDTTSSAMTGGLQALIEHPDQLARLQNDPELLTTAVDEMIRWVSPVRHFTRTAQADTEIGGVPIAEGDLVYLSYLAANRDPRVFTDPHRFDVGRANADRHVAFGFGAHFCLGAQLARMEMRTMFRLLLERLEWAELAGTPSSMRTIFVGGTKSLPINYRLRPAAA
ncbi:MAG: cytochrome P450 [Acidimicrobiales bacterium]